MVKPANPLTDGKVDNMFPPRCRNLDNTRPTATGTVSPANSEAAKIGRLHTTSIERKEH